MATQLEKKLVLPTVKTPTKVSLADNNILIHGLPKVGKSTWAAEMDNPIFFKTEEGLNFLEVYQVTIPDWPTFLEYAALIAEGKHEFKTVVIDTVSNLAAFCQDYVCKKAGIAHPADLGFGKGYDLIRSEFSRALIKLSLLPYGLVSITHSETVEIQSRTGNITRATARLPKFARDTLVPMADFILYFSSELTKDGEKRTIKTRPSENWEAGSKFKESTGFPSELPLSFLAFKTAFEEASRHE